ncbi:NAD-dependent deacetylase [Kineosphaera limosa]|uniref:NAD-dependent protein deacylase n=1 Tax=Kineosphaera limosa NBRC 100340 TaxID=1184609 RepID=K6WX45_9MICO|nr:NAD-dependent deacylase [Kineosphaera limosa]NYE00150.1 NAD-dependent deacetylase [Kineosphaera limosa]GAB98371.1 NAD-dependent deacetylase [Kineosphaera limosa NBRC 100340]
MRGLSPRESEWLLDRAAAARRVVVLSGAGMSAESGVPTFRQAQTGLWERFDPTMLATPDAWEADRPLVWAWYAWRLGLVRGVHPNAGHTALAAWGRKARVDIVTQNVDDLHERAGSQVLAHLHGSLRAFRCEACAAPYDGPIEVPAEPVERLDPPRCPDCRAAIRPGVVWFGEMLPSGAFDGAVDALLEADLVLVVGTSGLVHPAAGLPDIARGHGVPVVEVNPQETPLSAGVDLSWRITAAVGLPTLVDRLIEP